MTDTEKLIRATKRALNTTSKGKLAALLAERSRWQRKATIAENKLAAVRKEIETMAETMAETLLERELP